MNLSKSILIAKSAKKYVDYKRNKNTPFLVVINPTLHCNLNCIFCNAKIENSPIMSIQTLYKIIDQIAINKIPMISFSGGEPLLIKDIESVAKYAKKKHIYTNLNTNGTLIDKARAHKLAFSFDSIRISLNGTKSNHDEITGKNGSYEKIIKSLNHLLNIKNRTAKIGLNQIVTQQNQTNKIDKSLKNKLDFITYLPMFDFRHKKTNNHKEINSKLNKIFTGTQKNKKLTKYYCDAGKLYFFIGPWGNVFSCPFVPEEHRPIFKMGDLTKNSLSIILKNNKNTYTKYCNGCNATCTTNISKLFRSSPIDLLKKIPTLMISTRV